MIRNSVVGLVLLLLAAPLLADKKLDDRMMHAASILQEIRGPLEEDAPGILNDAYALAIFPEFVKVGLFGGVKHGRGVLATRLASGDWSKPAFVRITSGSIGLQFGVSMSQLLIVFKDPKAVEAISGGQFSIGADAGYAAGELGGSAGAGTDNKLDNKIVAMARSKGLFAGVALEGGVLRIEKDSNVEFYNDAIGLDGRDLLQDTEVEMPTVAQHFTIVLAESVPELSPEASPVSWARDNWDQLRLDEDGNAGRVAESAPSDPDRQNAQDTPESESAVADRGMDLTQPPPQAIASAPGSSAPGGTSQGSWVTPDGTELPSASAAQTSSAGASGVGNGATANNTPGNLSWASPQDAAAAGSDGSQEGENSGGSGLAGKIVGKATEAIWDGAKELALDSIRNTPEAKGASVAAKVGGKLIEGGGSKPKSPPKKPAQPPVAKVAGTGQTGEWVDPAQASSRIAAQSPDSLPAVSSAPGTAGAPLPAASSARSADMTGPPAPSDWPEEWRQSDLLGGICEPGAPTN